MVWIGKERKEGRKNYTLRIIKTIFVTTQNRERRKVFHIFFSGECCFSKGRKVHCMDVTLYNLLVFVVGLLDDGNYIH